MRQGGGGEEHEKGDQQRFSLSSSSSKLLRFFPRAIAPFTGIYYYIQKAYGSASYKGRNFFKHNEPQPQKSVCLPVKGAIALGKKS